MVSLRSSLFTALVVGLLPVAGAKALRSAPPPVDITGTVRDSANGQPVQSADVVVMQNGSVVLTTATDAFGRYTLHNLAPGAYVLTVRNIGFVPFRAPSPALAGALAMRA